MNEIRGTLENIAAVFAAYEKCFGPVWTRIPVFDDAQDALDDFKTENPLSYRVGSRWSDNSKLNLIRSNNKVTVDFYLNDSSAMRHHGEEIELAEKEFYDIIAKLGNEKQVLK